MKKLLLFMAVMMVLPSVAWAAPDRSFPEAEGSGAKAITTCDRSNIQVLTVSSLADSGAGTLRQAFLDMDTNANRLKIVRFTVAGVINLTGINTSRECFYIAGQTAPGGGITIASNGISMRSSNGAYVVRYVRFRNNFVNWLHWGGNRGAIFDHISGARQSNSCFTAAYDPARSYSSAIRYLTVSRMLCAETITHPTGSFFNSEYDWIDKLLNDNDYHHNLFVSVSHRNPMSNSMRSKVVNNVVYNWNQGASSTFGTGRVDWINNYYKKGPRTNVTGIDYEVTLTCSWTDFDGALPLPAGSISWYVSGNIGPHNATGTGDQWTGATRVTACYYTTGGALGTAIPDPIYGISVKRNPHTPDPDADIPITIQTAEQAYTSVVVDGDVGANKRIDCNGNWVNAQDSLDTGYLNDVRNGTGPNTVPTGLITIPPIDPGTTCQVSGADGIPDAWKDRYGLVRTTDYRTTIGAGDYTYWEHYINNSNPLTTPPGGGGGAGSCLESVLCVTAGADNTDATSYATASVTPAANTVYLLFVYGINAAGAPQPTASGWGATWTEQRTQATGSGLHRQTVFRTLTGPSPSVGAVTINVGGVGYTAAMWALVKVPAGGPTSGDNGANAVAQVASTADGVSQTTQTVNLAAFQHAENDVLAGFTVGGTRTASVGAGLTTIAESIATDVTGKLVVVHQATQNTAPMVTWSSAATTRIGVGFELASQVPLVGTTQVQPSKPPLTDGGIQKSKPAQSQKPRMPGR